MEAGAAMSSSLDKLKSRESESAATLIFPGRCWEQLQASRDVALRARQQEISWWMVDEMLILLEVWLSKSTPSLTRCRLHSGNVGAGTRLDRARRESPDADFARVGVAHTRNSPPQQ